MEDIEATGPMRRYDSRASNLRRPPGEMRPSAAALVAAKNSACCILQKKA